MSLKPRFRPANLWKASLILLANSLLAGALVAQDPETAAPPFAEIIDVDIVNVEVYVVDKKGDPVTGLRAEDFVLLDSGEEIEISNFYAVEDGERLSFAVSSAEGGAVAVRASKAEPTFLVVYVDNNLLEPFSRTRVLLELQDFLKERQKKGDHIMIVGFDGFRTHVLQPFTTSWRPLKTTIEELRESGSLSFARENRYREVIEEMLAIHDMHMMGPGATPCPPAMMRSGRFYVQNRYDEVKRSLEGLTGFVKELAGFSGRKALLHVSDGLPQVPGSEIFEFVFRFCGGGGVADGREEFYDSRSGDPNMMPAHLAQLDALEFNVTQELEDLTDHANANEVTFFTLEGYGPRSPAPGTDPRPSWQIIDHTRVADLQNGLNVLAHETGGQAFFNVANFESVFNRMGEDLGTYYSLGYAAQSEDRRERKIKIKVPGQDVRIRYRRSSRTKSLSEELSDRTNGTLLFELVDNPLGVELEVGSPSPMDDSLHVVPVRLDIPLSSLAFLPEEGGRRGHVTVYLAARDRDGRTAPVRTTRVPITIPEAEFESAQKQRSLYEVKMLMRPGDHSVAVGVHDDFGATASYLRQEVAVVSR